MFLGLFSCTFLLFVYIPNFHSLFQFLLRFAAAYSAHFARQNFEAFFFLIRTDGHTYHTDFLVSGRSSNLHIFN